MSLDTHHLSPSVASTEAKPAAGKRRVRRVATIVSTVAVVLVALVVIFAVDSYTVLGSSMQPTHDGGDKVFVNRFASAEVNDIVVASTPFDLDQLTIKRVVAAGGDTFAFVGCRVVLNGQAVVDALGGGVSCGADVAEMTVPAGHVFLLGDNRGGSRDSRAFGPVPIDQIVGVAIRW